MEGGDIMLTSAIEILIAPLLVGQYSHYSLIGWISGMTN